ncbi:uncharacterized protein LOC133113213 [Conger conger]|uniref:uncharacterized protein LOC133113213 n=1 Tax=Conger conger TaxID=82655 RepID=UPI002A5A494A|nr:uncharacterized protein LOC133113213 [Conger conger]
MAPQLQTRTTPQFQNIPYQYPHARHSKSMTESVRNHFLSQSRMSMDCHIPNESSSLGKTYPNQRPEGEINIDQDAGHSWCSGGAGSKEIQWGSLGKVIDSPNHRGNNMPQSSELARPYTKNSSPTVSDYAHPTRKSLSNELNSTSAVQQLLLKAAEPARGNESSVGQVKPHAPSSPLPSLSSLERRSVICDLSPSCLTTHARERSSEGDTVSILPLTGSSVIQQSPSTSVLNQEDSKEEKLHKAMLREEALKTMKEVQNSKKCNYSHSFTKGTTIQLQNRMQQPCGPHQLDTIPGGSVKTAKMPILHTQQAPQQLIPTPNPLSSPSSRFQLYFQGLDESSHHSTGVDGFGLRDSGDGTVKISPRHSYQLSHHNLNASQPKNSQPTNKLQMYPHSHSLQHLHSLNDRLEWGSNTNQPSSQDLMMSPDSSKNQCHAGIRSTPDVLANPQLPPPQGSYYSIGKMWGPSLPGRENKGIMEGDSYRRNEPPVAPSGPMVLPSMPLVVSRHLESNSSRIVTEDVVKSFHQMSTPIKQSDSSSVSGNSGLLGPQGKTKMGGSGDTNPLIMRRRVRSFISPIPAKRQHQDISQQQQQRGVSSMHPSHLSNSDVKPNVDIDPFSPDVPKHKTVSTSDSLDSPPPSLGKMDVLPLRKGRGLKLEAIVQKITPNTKKTNEDSESNTDSTSSLSHTEMTCISDLKDYNSSVGENFSRMETGSVSCLPYLNEGISLEEIISYREVEEIGPLPPTAYQCDPHQDTHILKCDLIEKPTRTTVRDLESALDFGIGVPGAPKSERDTARDGGKDELSPDFTLLGPLPPPPPLPRPVQATSPPSSSALSDIQHFTTTYQQLETRREHSAATLLRQKLEEGEMCLGLDDYSGRDVLGTKSPHHNQNPNHCLLSIPPQNQPHQQHISTGSISSVNGEPQYTQTKPSDSAVPRGYFPSGKKRGRPVGSVNKQKRIQGQSQNASLNASPVTEMPTSVPTATPQTEVQSITSAIPINKTNSDNETSMPLTSVTISLAAKEEIESEEREPEMEANPCRQKGRKEEIGNETDGVVTMPTQRSVVDVFEGEVNSAGIRGNLSSSGVFPTSRKPVFAPYIHVERKLEELGNVCSIVNAEDEKKKAESGEERGGKWTGKEMGGGPVASINPTHTSQSTRNDGERVRSKEKRGAEKENASHIHSSPTGKVLPSSGYVISGSVMTEIDAFGHLLCCLCKKWANYKDLGDLYGPYYPPEYALRFPKNPSVIRQSLGPSSVSTVGALAGAAKIEMKQEITPVALQQCEPATDSSLTGNQTTDPLAATSTDKEASVSALDRHCSSNKGNKDWELTQIPANEVLKQEEQPNEISQLLENEQHVEDIQKRPQHRKLTSHPRFKRRHKSSEDLPKTGPTNSKALLPFQPPPPLPLPNQDSSDPSAPLSLLPQVPLDPDELWVHEGCIIWASGVYLVNGRLYGVQEALDGARETCCSHCKAMGSTLGCYSKGCTLRYHYLCATEAGCALNEDNFSLRCPKHKFPQNNRPVKPVCPAQSEIG